MGARPRTSRDFKLLCADVEASKSWHAEFVKPAYRGRQFLDLKGPKGQVLLPSTHKGGPWMSGAGSNVSTFSRFCRCITGHAPIGEYRQRFNIDGPIHCGCRHGLLQTRDHVVSSCRLVVRPKRKWKPGTVLGLCDYLEVNPGMMAFTLYPRLLWDPG